MTPGEEVYVKHCKLCHGSSGDLGLSGAANLKISVLNNAEIMTVVSDGRKAMPGWKAQLTPTNQRCGSLCNYIEKLITT